jgi:hypothetical protein
VNPGGEPERDDFGLPPVDIQIPDDARELDRDVQAYHREQRALRRHLRRRRLGGPLAADGMVLPLLAGCLVFALIAAVLLTVFAATGDVALKPPAHAGLRRSPGPDLIGPRTPAPSGSRVVALTGKLPDKTIVVSGRNVPLRTLTASALALVPPGCACLTALRQLASQAAQSRVRLYLVAAMDVASLRAIAARQPAVLLATESQHVLARTYKPNGLTVILVSASGSLALAHSLQPGLQLGSELRGLRQRGSPAASPSG